MIYFADENISYRAVRILNIFDEENEVRAHSDSFAPGTPDEDWIVEVAKWEAKPVLICGDGRILRNKDQRKLPHDSELMFVHLAKGWMNIEWNDFAWKIIKVWPDIVRLVRRTRVPSILEVGLRSEKVELRGAIAELTM